MASQDIKTEICYIILRPHQQHPSSCDSKFSLVMIPDPFFGFRRTTSVVVPVQSGRCNNFSQSVYLIPKFNYIRWYILGCFPPGRYGLVGTPTKKKPFNFQCYC